MRGPQAAIIAGGRLHLHHGPIDLIIGVDGPEVERHEAFAQAERRFRNILPELVVELPALRRPATALFKSPVARRMAAAITPHQPKFITPMAAVAGAVADEILAATIAGRPVTRAYVNNGGDIALHLSPGESFGIGLTDDDGSEAGAPGDRETGAQETSARSRVRSPGQLSDEPEPLRVGVTGSVIVRSTDPVRGVATSGWRGRSLSLGIADTVTVLAASAAMADAAATLIANAVDLPSHPAIQRMCATELDPDSDLGARLATVAVGAIGQADIEAALAAGADAAAHMLDRQMIFAATLHLQGAARTIGAPRPAPSGPTPLNDPRRVV